LAGSSAAPKPNNRNWELSEEGNGLRVQDDSEADITHIFAHNGDLLAGPGSRAEFGAQPDAELTGLKGLLRYYIAAGRRVILQDGMGVRWPARIISTRWRSGGRIWSFRSPARAAHEPEPDQKEA
jgi:hypothetical protein